MRIGRIIALLAALASSLQAQPGPSPGSSRFSLPIVRNGELPTTGLLARRSLHTSLLLDRNNFWLARDTPRVDN